MRVRATSESGGGGTKITTMTLVDSWDNPSGVSSYTYNNLDATKTYLVTIATVPGSGLHLGEALIVNNTLSDNDMLILDAQWTVSVSGTRLTITRTSSVTMRIRVCELS